MSHCLVWVGYEAIVDYDIIFVLIELFPLLVTYYFFIALLLFPLFFPLVVLETEVEVLF